MGCIYLLKFKNNKDEIVGLYIGRSVNLKNRIKAHNVKLKHPKREVSKARLRYNFEYEILSDDILDNDLLRDMEYFAIKTMKELGLNNYNRYIGDKLDEIRVEQMSHNQMGSNNSFYGKHHSKEYIEKLRIDNLSRNNPNANNITFYESNGRSRSAFKLSCRKLGYNFDDFIEEFYGWYIKPDGRRERLYTYIIKKG